MVTGMAVPEGGKQLCAAHIWPYCTHGHGLERFGLSRLDVNSPRNGLMLFKVIEEAFDAKRCAFVYDGDADAFTFMVLDPALLTGTVHAQHKFGDFDGAALQLPSPRDGRAAVPFRRLLVWHLSQALQTALDRRWRTVEQLQPLFTPTAQEKVQAWLENTSPGVKWPGQRAFGMQALRTAQEGSAASDDEDVLQ